MATISIISPDPEIRRLFELYFQLKNLHTRTFLDEKGFSPHEINIIDIIEDSKDYWDTATHISKLARKLKGAKLVAILPRGLLPEKAKTKLQGFHLIISRPFEFSDVVGKIIELL